MKSTLLLLLILLSLNSCQTVVSNPGGLLSATDIKSSQPDGYSAETMAMVHVTALLNEKNDGYQTVSKSTARTYWANQMKDIRAKESKEYYDRVFEKFPDARKELGLFPITVRSYN